VGAKKLIANGHDGAREGRTISRPALRLARTQERARVRRMSAHRVSIRIVEFRFWISSYNGIICTDTIHERLTSYGSVLGSFPTEARCY